MRCSDQSHLRGLWIVFWSTLHLEEVTAKSKAIGCMFGESLQTTLTNVHTCNKNLIGVSLSSQVKTFIETIHACLSVIGLGVLFVCLLLLCFFQMWLLIITNCVWIVLWKGSWLGLEHSDGNVLGSSGKFRKHVTVDSSLNTPCP